MNRLLASFLSLTLSLLPVSTTFAKKPAPISRSVSSSVQVTVYGYKKARDYIAVELGFKNTTDDYVDFTPREIYLDDAEKFSNPPLDNAKLQQIVMKSGSDVSMVPAILGIGLGIGALAAGASGHSGTSTGLGIAALGMGGAFILSKGLQDSSQQRKLIAFESNTFSDIKRLPPGMTLGGWLYFPKTKKESTLTIVAKKKGAGYERLQFPLKGMKR
jgi:hypothetical protein